MPADPTKAHVASQWAYTSPLIACRFDPKGRYVFSSAEDSTIQRWDVPSGNKINFTALTLWPGDLVCAEGRYLEGNTEKRAAIFIGPEFGTVQRADLVAAAREAGDAAFDVLIACAFNSSKCMMSRMISDAFSANWWSTSTVIVS